MKEDSGGEGGIRTPDTLLGCNCLAGSPVQPLQHLSAVARTEACTKCNTRPTFAGSLAAAGKCSTKDRERSQQPELKETGFAKGNRADNELLNQLREILR